jgi:hypothetical protein
MVKVMLSRNDTFLYLALLTNKQFAMIALAADRLPIKNVIIVVRKVLLAKPKLKQLISPLGFVMATF